MTTKDSIKVSLSIKESMKLLRADMGYKDTKQSKDVILGLLTIVSKTDVVSVNNDMVSGNNDMEEGDLIKKSGIMVRMYDLERYVRLD